MIIKFLFFFTMECNYTENNAMRGSNYMTEIEFSIFDKTVSSK